MEEMNSEIGSVLVSQNQGFSCGTSFGRGRGLISSYTPSTTSSYGRGKGFQNTGAGDTDSGWNIGNSSDVSSDQFVDSEMEYVTSKVQWTSFNDTDWIEDNSSDNKNYSSNDYSGQGLSSGGQKGCFKCGESGHMSRDCPNAVSNSGRTNNRSCFKCGEDGHISRDCPNSNNNKSSSRGCFKCGEDGHMSRDCPNSDTKSNKGCFKCGEEGHMSRECPNGGGGGGGNKSRACFKCGEDGHMSRDCPNAGSGGGNKSKGCFKCGEEDHISRDCPNSDSSSKKGSGECYKCHETGHMARECPNAKDGDSEKKPPYIPPALEQTEEVLFDGSLSIGINFDKYDDIPVQVNGINKPAPISTFEETSLRDLLKSNIKRAKYIKPTPIQKYSIPIVLQGRDLMACAQTGSGKTAAFLLPILHFLLESGIPSAAYKDTQEPLALIIAPTRELAIQIYTEACKFAYSSIIRSVVVYGGTSFGHQARQLQGGCHILVATPGRLNDLVEKGKISFSQLKFLVLDEADRMLDMGFIPVVRSIVTHPTVPPKSERHTLMFSATFPEEIQRLAAEFLEDYLFLVVGMVGGANTDVEQTFMQVQKFDKRKELAEILREAVANGEKVLVFVETKRSADFVASLMSQQEIPTTSIHGDRLQREREEALADFRSGRMPVLVATAVAARGLDIKNVSRVVNYDLPESIDEYVHRIGRTGRVGNIGRAVSFYDSSQDQALARPLLKILQDAEQPVPDWLVSEAKSAGTAGPTHSYNKKFGARDIRNIKESSNEWDISTTSTSSEMFSGGDLQSEEIWD